MVLKYLSRISMFVLVLFVCMGCAQKEATVEIRQAFVALELFEYEEALKIFEAITTSNQEELRIIARGEGLAYRGLTQYEDAIMSFQRALSYSNGIPQEIDYDINYHMADVYCENGDYEKAMERYELLITLQPKVSQAYYLKGVLLLEQGMLEESCNAFEGAIKCDTDDYDLVIAISQNLKEVGEEERGKEYLQETLQQANGKLDALTLGKLYYYIEEYDQARLYLDQVKGSSEEVTLMLGKTYEELDDINYAVGVYEDYLQTNITSGIIYNRLALCLVSQGRYSEALEKVQAAIKLGNTTMTQALLYNEIVIYEYLGEFTEAAVLMKSYILKFPDDENAIRENEFLETR